MEQVEVLKEYRSIDISLDEFLEMMRKYKKKRQSEKTTAGCNGSSPSMNIRMIRSVKK